MGISGNFDVVRVQMSALKLAHVNGMYHLYVNTLPYIITWSYYIEIAVRHIFFY